MARLEAPPIREIYTRAIRRRNAAMVEAALAVLEERRNGIQRAERYKGTSDQKTLRIRQPNQRLANPKCVVPDPAEKRL